MTMAQSLTVLQPITPHRFAGAEKQVGLFSHALIKRGHHPTIIMPARVPLFEQFLQKRNVPFELLNIGGKLNLLAQGRIEKLARTVAADIIQTHLSSASQWGLRAARHLGIPSIGHVHGMNSARWYRDADIILAGTQGIADYLIADGAPESKVRIIYYAIDREEFEVLRPVAEVRAELGLALGQPTIGMAASLVARKGHRHLLDAIALLRPKLPDLVALIVGQGPLLATLQAQAERLGISRNVCFLGWVPSALDVMQAMDLLILPSTRIEGFGVCLVEAAYLGKPGVASDLPGIREAVVDGETGLMAPVGDPPRLAEAIGTLLTNRNLYETFARQGKERTERLFTVERMAEELEGLYVEVLGR
jgi:glycosyltransferase involved in cell wall biosynthesis